MPCVFALARMFGHEFWDMEIGVIGTRGSPVQCKRNKGVFLCFKGQGLMPCEFALVSSARMFENEFTDVEIGIIDTPEPPV